MSDPSDQPPDPSEASRLLTAWSGGDASALDRLIPIVYRELRKIAQQQMRYEPAGRSLQATDLVNEAYLRLVQQQEARWQHRSQFLAIAAKMMRRILVDRARRRGYQKRGQHAVHVDIEDVAIIAPERPADLVALDEALKRLEQHNARHASVVELRYFAGLTIDEIARCLDVAPITVKRDWSLAKAWLYRDMRHAGRTPTED